MKTRKIDANAPFIRNHLNVDMTGSESQRFDDAVKKTGRIKTKLVRELIVKWTDEQLGAPSPKAK